VGGVRRKDERWGDYVFDPESVRSFRQLAKVARKAGLTGGARLWGNVRTGAGESRSIQRGAELVRLVAHQAGELDCAISDFGKSVQRALEVFLNGISQRVELDTDG
jgi:hypothetical protein